ncbi:MAG TPA: hypothetical protein VK593_01630, partial [Edaphobacter sp.]|nr:hypothetical protein [Edaphobacter sp.]
DRDPHPFARPWEDPNERAGVLAKMQTFARAKLAAYGVVPGVTPPTAIAGTTPAIAGTTPATSGTTAASTNPNSAPDSGPPTLKRGIPSKASVTTETPDAGPPTLKRGVPQTSTATTGGTAAAAPKTSSTAARKTGTAATSSKTRKSGKTAAAPVTLADEDLKSYTLSYGGTPTYVYMAHTVETGSVMRYVTIIAQDNGMGELKVALSSATDAAHLDRTPWMRLIDVVDVEASNRASLLFELRGQSSRQFSLYRVIAARPEQIFLTGSAM